MATVVEALEVPIVQAPLSGGPSTPELAAAVSGAGGLGFLAAGYKTADAIDAEIDATRTLTERPFGVNVFARPAAGQPREAVEEFIAELAPEAERLGVELGEPRHTDDEYDAKIDVLARQAPAVASFTFGCPTAWEITALKGQGCEVWVTVTSPDEAQRAREAGADALVVQGAEAGGHRGAWIDTRENEEIGLLALLAVVQTRAEGLPLIAAGGIMTGRAIAAVLTAGATAAALGTAFLRCPEAGTQRPAPRRDRQRPAHATDARLHRTPRARDRQPLAGRALGRRADRLPGRPLRDRPAARPRAQPGRRRRRQPVGRPGP